MYDTKDLDSIVPIYQNNGNHIASIKTKPKVFVWPDISNRQFSDYK